MSAAYPFICPACEREFRSMNAVRQHIGAKADAEHGVAAALADAALANPAFGKPWGTYSWSPGTPQHDALAPLREWRAAQESTR